MGDCESLVDSNLKDSSLQFLNNLRKTETMTDITLMSVDGQPTKVHKIILWAASTYFRGIFESNLIESRQNIIQLRDDIVHEDLNFIIEYLYTGEAQVSIENAKNYYVKAQFFNLKALQNLCGQMLLKSISHENCLDYWRHAVKYLNDELRDACIKYFARNATILIDKYLLELTLQELEIISSHNCLKISEEKLFSAITMWVNSNLETRKEHLQNLIKNIDFTKMTQEFLEIEIQKNELLFTDKEIASELFRVMLTWNFKLQKNQSPCRMQDNRKILLVNGKSVGKYNLDSREYNLLYNLPVDMDQGYSAAIWQKKLYLTDYKSRNLYLSDLIYHDTKTLCVIPNKITSCISIGFKDKICMRNSSTKDFYRYDINHNQFITGPEMNGVGVEHSLCASDDCVYSVDVLQIERFDDRDSKWNIIHPTLEPSGFDSLISGKTEYLNQSIYHINRKFQVSRFDLRTNKWEMNIHANIPLIFDQLIDEHNFYDTATIGNTIYTGTVNSYSWTRTFNLYQYETEKSNTWSTTKTAKTAKTAKTMTSMKEIPNILFYMFAL